MKVIGIAAALALPALVLAGLEDAKYSTVLGSDNFNKVINSQSVGTLVAFFAPWCGHCKSLEGTWTKVAQAFQDDDRCKVAHLDADNANNRPLAEKYGVQGFPTIKFIPTGGGKAVDYQGARSEEAFLEFLNEKCGTHRLPGSALSDMVSWTHPFA
ncbi:BQ5605_C009g05635 [Microbotryum silenes-dioicae]|uniref:BQ5605_C009g05635 protein n=1 Tax=Microbotryum silenes-dioicae TaxID=796604 RepID=A0A2X0P8Y8_9BASI|nr:BQ5605_C009g05635 [Microbotryum silenes-dioicae]